MKKLIYISNSKLPTNLAHGLQIMQVCSAFIRAGYEVELMVPYRIRALNEDPFKYYGVERNFKITKIPCLDFLFISGNKFTFLTQLLSFLFFCRLAVLFKKYDLLYSRESAAGVFFAGTALEIHSLPKTISASYLWILKRSGALIVLTGFIKDRMVKMGIDEDKILVAPDAVNLEKFNINISSADARKKLGLPQDKKLVGYVGMLRTLGMEKGIDVAIRAFSEIKSEPDINLVLVGGHDDDISHYKKSAKNAGIEDRVIFTGMVRHDLVPDYLKAFDVLIAPFPENEHYSFYMSPLKIFEYMASGRPIISTDLPSLKEVLDGSNSVLVSPGSSSELAAAILRVLGDKDFSGKISAQALSDAEKYTWDKRSQKTISFIGSLSGNREIKSEKENIASFSSDISVEKYSKKYLRPGEEYVIRNYMPAESAVLDLGCGAGRTTSHIFENGCKVVGVDISETLIARAKKDYPEIDFRVMDARKMDFKDGVFDAVFFSFNGIDNLLSLTEREKAISEIRRVLKPGGYFIYSSHNSLALPRTSNSRRIIIKNLSRLRIGPHFRAEEYDFGKVTQYYNNVWNESARLLSSGFKTVRVIGNGKRLLLAPKFILAFLDKFPIYIAQK